MSVRVLFGFLVAFHLLGYLQGQGKAISLGADLFGQISNTLSDNYESVMAKIEQLEWRTNNPKPTIDLIMY